VDECKPLPQSTRPTSAACMSGVSPMEVSRSGSAPASIITDITAVEEARMATKQEGH